MNTFCLGCSLGGPGELEERPPEELAPWRSSQTHSEACHLRKAGTYSASCPPCTSTCTPCEHLDAVIIIIIRSKILIVIRIAVIAVAAIITTILVCRILLLRGATCSAWQHRRWPRRLSHWGLSTAGYNMQQYGSLYKIPPCWEQSFRPTPTRSLYDGGCPSGLRL